MQSDYKEITMATQVSALKTESGERDAVIRAMQSYIEGVKLGDSKIMRPGFHQNATIFGHYPGGVMANPITALFEWIDKNGPSPNLQTEFTKVEVLESIAVVHLEVRDLSGAVAGTRVHMSDIFTLLRTDEGWKIAHKAFHWHNR
jgi:Putative lumazine-binding